MSAILSADDLNDFIAPGVACIKPIETLPEQAEDDSNPYEVTTEDKVAAEKPPPPAQISLTDCLACSGCVTSAEAVLVSLQSHTEVLNILDTHPSLPLPWTPKVNGGAAQVANRANGMEQHHGLGSPNAKLFVASVSPQARASLAATYGISERLAGNLITQLLAGPEGLKTGGAHRSHFTWVFDTNNFREAVLMLGAEEVIASLEGSKKSTVPKKPILTSACPGWICYAEKTHPYVLPHLSALKSPQALAGTMIKSVLASRYGIRPESVWHLAVMPCFDKKLEASRSELTSSSWLGAHDTTAPPVRDVDCVITVRELLSLAVARSIDLRRLPAATPAPQLPFPDETLNVFLRPRRQHSQGAAASTSGGYLWHALATLRAQHPDSEIRAERGRNADVVEYVLKTPEESKEIVRMARFYGFRNIQNLVRRLKPARASRMPGAAARKVPAKGGTVGSTQGGTIEYAYVEVMACPGGCTNGGGQVRVGEVDELRGGTVSGDEVATRPGLKEQREWLARVDEAYFSAESDEDDGNAMEVDREGLINGIDTRMVKEVLEHWEEVTGIELEKLVKTSYRAVESDVGKKKGASDVERVAGLASSLGGGW